jgi:hypothetical protein
MSDITDAGPRLKAMNDALERERLRLTDAERKAIDWAAYAAEQWYEHTAAATLRGLLARMSGNGDYPALDIAATQDNSDSPQPIANCNATPTPPSTPTECTVPPEWTSRPYWVDPPSGWRYGFPRLYDPAADGDMTAWMIANGYPEKLASQGLPCTFTASTEDGGK